MAEAQMKLRRYIAYWYKNQLKKCPVGECRGLSFELEENGLLGRWAGNDQRNKARSLQEDMGEKNWRKDGK